MGVDGCGWVWMCGCVDLRDECQCKCVLRLCCAIVCTAAIHGNEIDKILDYSKPGAIGLVVTPQSSASNVVHLRKGGKFIQTTVVSLLPSLLRVGWDVPIALSSPCVGWDGCTQSGCTATWGTKESAQPIHSLPSGVACRDTAKAHL